MVSKLRLSSLIPAGLIVDSIVESENAIVVTARGEGEEKACPLCRRYLRIAEHARPFAEGQVTH